MDQLSNTNFPKLERAEERYKDPPSPFLAFLEEEEEEEEEAPLLDGPVTAPFTTHTSLGAAHNVIPALPRSLVEVAKQIIEPMRAVSEKGITKIELVITSKTLSEITVKIDHYDTAPHCFNIELCGSENAQALFSKYQTALIESLQRALPAFQITLLPIGFPLVKTRRVGYVAVKSRKKSHE